MTQLNKNARARRRAQRERAATLEAVTARLLGAPTFGTTTGRLQKDDLMDAMVYGSQWSPGQIAKLKSTHSRSVQPNKIRGLRAYHILIDEFTDLEKRITP